MLKRRIVEDTLLKIGVPAGIQGFRYIADAVMLLDSPKHKNIKTIILYDKVAELNNATGSRVERSIRHALTSTREHVGETEDVLRYIGGKETRSADALKLLYTRLKNEDDAKVRERNVDGLSKDEITLRRIIREEVREFLKGVLLGGDTL